MSGRDGLKEPMASTQIRTKHFFKDKMDAVQFVSDHLLSLKPGSVWTMTIRHWKSEGYFVHSATEDWSDVYAAVETLLASKEPQSTS